ncbi:exosortase family protein XrtF [Lutibacter sp.]|uniref:exosortase family protein XrtF n=1 Tax=Lutibacter sp. TaxID=1925666 RepID=UPI0025B9CA3C|nr:exosortase family protein XrtF [Lutibacter sp.]MCF6181663.1 exosortase family protein XrtF [Lutibacter sp.]
MQSNKSVIYFLIKFFGVYALLFVLYAWYLNENQVKKPYFACAPITKNVANQTENLLNFVGYHVSMEQHTKEVSINILVNNKLVARIIEGCNSVSIIILYIAFIIAFKGSFKNTILFIIGGSLLIYYFNIVRIAIISIAIYKYPEYEKTLHEIIFPLLIYGLTFLLWFIWVKKFASFKR